MASENLDHRNRSLPHAAKALLLWITALWIGGAAAQPDGKPPAPARAEGSHPGTDPAIIVRPPTQVDPRIAEPPPRNIDPALVQRPPTDVRPDDRGTPRTAPSTRSRRDDCRGSAEDCKQNSAR